MYYLILYYNMRLTKNEIFHRVVIITANETFSIHPPLVCNFGSCSAVDTFSVALSGEEGHISQFCSFIPL